MKSDIRDYKRELRIAAKEKRRMMDPEEKKRKDQLILQGVLKLYRYKTAKTVITYVSKDIEVDTLGLIAQALRDGKQVAVPRCVEGTRDMEFYLITSREDLVTGAYGVWEPDPNRCRLLDDFSESICIVPGLIYDRKGYRLGYGAGYYDRFLSAYTGYMIGIVYSNCLRHNLWHGRYDIPVHKLIYR